MEHNKTLFAGTFVEKLDTKAIAITLVQIQTKSAENYNCILHPDEQEDVFSE